MKLISWNVNGLRACIGHGFYEYLYKEKPDFFCVQETKMQPEQEELPLDGYIRYWNSADKKGYSGTLIMCKKEPINVIYGMNEKYSDEGRLITLEYDKFYLVNIYSPNSQEELKRLDYRMKFEDDLRAYLKDLKNKKSVIVCGDLNVAHNEIDLKNPKTNTQNPGFSIQEREKFSALLSEGFIDTFRFLYPQEVKYSWWSYRFFAREKGIGWRIDYFLVSEELKNNIVDSRIHNEILGSDHCPTSLIINI